MKEVQIDVTQNVCKDSAVKIKKVLEQLRQNRIAVSKIEIIADTQEGHSKAVDFLLSENYLFETQLKNGLFYIQIQGKKNPQEIQKEKTQEDLPYQGENEFVDKIFVFSSDRIGQGELGEKLLEGLLHNICTGLQIPREIVFINRGVLVCIDMEKNLHITRTLKKLEERGVRISACGTCLEYYNVKDLLCVGNVGNSAEITRQMLKLEVVNF